MKRIVLERLVGILLIAAVLTVYLQVVRHDFINFDDGVYVTHNNHVQSGLTGSNILWAFTSMDASNWHPLTWLSYLLDFDLFGLNPAGYHLTNLFFHVVNTLLLFLVLRESTGSLWKSAVVAAIFGLHPLHVESVAWISERKDVLSGFFWMLTILAYIHYSRNSGTFRYLLVFVSFSLGLMAKPMLVTLPFVLLLMDYWPLGRINLPDFRKAPNSKKLLISSPEIASSLKLLLLEKVPLLILSTASSLITWIAQAAGNSILTFETLSLKVRIINAFVAYLRYIGKILWASDLAIFYPHPVNTLTIWQGAVSALSLLIITAFILMYSVRSPFLLLGWFWFMGTLVPVIGLVQVGSQAMADRYAYLPAIGIYVLVVWGTSKLLADIPFRKPLLAFTTSTFLLCLSIATWIQLGHWQDSETIFRHTIAVTKRNYVAHFNLGTALFAEDKVDEAVGEYTKALKIWPSYPDAHNNIGVALHRQGHMEEAITHYEETLRTKPKHITAHLNMAQALVGIGKLDEALVHCSEAILIDPTYGAAYNIMGIIMAKLNKMDKAVEYLSSAIDLCRKCYEPYNNLGRVLTLQGKFDKAIEHLQKAIELRSDYAEAYNNLGFVLVRVGSLEKALYYTTSALHFKPDYPKARANLRNIVQLISKTPEEKKTTAR